MPEEDAGSFLKWRPVDGDDRNPYSASMNRDADWSPVWGTSTRWGFNKMSHPKGNPSEWLWGTQFQQFLIEFQLMILLIQLLSFKLKLSVIWAPIISIIKLLSQKKFEFYWKLLIKLMTQLAIQSLGWKFGFQASRKWSCWISAALNWFHFERLSNEFFNWIWNRKIRLLLSNGQGLSDSKFAGRAHHSTISGHDGIPQDWQVSSTWMLNQFHHLITFV